jgi:oxalate decarboxylase/phosphoglucose isomerase-like protein (cupin superfamily)
MQLPGDVVYVPDEWGHAVVNVADTVAVAYEFHE